MNNNIIPACIIGAGLFAVALKPAPQPAPIPQAEPVAVATASVTGPSEPVIVWYDVVAMPTAIAEGVSGRINSTDFAVVRSWSDGTIEAKRVPGLSCSKQPGNCQWFVISTPQMACRTDINGDGEVELGDLLAVLSQWGDQATCLDTVQLQCELGLPNG
jgi:hypothetical protein